MFAKRTLAFLLLGAGAMTTGSCASSRAPAGWLPSAAETQTQAYGAWIRISTETPGGTAVADGELIAVERDTVFVLSSRARGGGLQALPKDRITGGTLGLYDPDTGLLVAWTVAGTLSTLSHGFFLMLSAPVWVLGGSGATIAYSHNAARCINVNRIGEWEVLKLYARFPQGMPEGMDRSALLPKPAPAGRRGPPRATPR